MRDSSKPVPTGIRVAYGLGSLAEGTKDTVFSIFLLFYYHSVLGLPGWMAGLAIFLALCLDAVTDPLVGVLSDRTRSRWGRRHPWMYAAILPMGFATAGLFMPPAGLGQTGLFLWLLLFAVLVRQGMTLYAVPSNAMLPEFSDDYDERTEIVGLRFLFGWLAGLTVSVIAYMVFFDKQPDGTDGRLIADAWPDFGLFAGLAVSAGIAICAFGTHRWIPQLCSAPPEQLAWRVIVRDLDEALHNPAFRPLLWSALFSAAAWGYIAATSLYVNTWFWGLTSEQIGIISMAMYISVMAAAGLAPFLAANSDKRWLAIRLALVSMVLGPLPIVLRFLGLFPENGTRELLSALFFHVMFLFAIIIAINIVTASMIADVTDDSELRCGKRHEGVFAAVMTLIIKATSGLGTLFAGLVVDITGFAATPESIVPDSVANSFALAVTAGIMLLFGVSVFFLARYPITRQRYSEIRRKLSLYQAKD